ncbi:MAG: glycosyltransferase family 2 protein [Acetobacteraceae bacterium]|nr:glycosyltransferase family 2 protein [Acetobacteraceae bacterium]
MSAVPRVAILLSTYNGAPFLPAQLESLTGQSVRDWALYWRDDGSSDATLEIMREFAEGAGAGRCHPVEMRGHLGATESFMALLRAAAPSGVPLAFADQDDVWLPEKLELALRALENERGPVLYCSRQILVDEALAPLGESNPLRRPPCFPAALTQNIATGCTVVLNPAAAALVARSRPPAASLHDWWSYLLVAASGGRIIADPTRTVLYRQHASNLVGAPASIWRRARAAMQRGPGAFMAVLREHVTALQQQPELLSAEARRLLSIIDRGLRGGPAARLRALALPGLYRQRWSETILFRWWFLVG